MTDRAAVFAAIWGKATGGRSVAMDPHLADAAGGYTVAPAPGVQEACEWLLEGLASQPDRRMVFLVGGPGGGKSHALTQVTASLEKEESEDTGLAQRKYHFRSAGSRLTVVNDASIRGGDDRHPLADDVDLALAEGDCFLGCVNRGILVEEAHALAGDTAGGSIVKWLAGVSRGSTEFALVTGQDSAIIASAKLQVGVRTSKL